MNPIIAHRRLRRFWYRLSDSDHRVHARIYAYKPWTMRAREKACTRTSILATESALWSASIMTKKCYKWPRT
jgi:hypothetical protein